MAAALEELREQCNHLRVLGSYPLRTADGAHLRQPVVPEREPVEETVSCPSPSVVVTREEAATDARPKTSVVPVGEVLVGSDRFTMILGPCAAENRNQIHAAAEMVKSAGASMLRGGAFKPRTSPHSFQGLGQEGLDLLREAGNLVELPIVTG